METQNKRKVMTNAEKIEKLKTTIKRYEDALAKAKEQLTKLESKQRSEDMKALCQVLLDSGKSIDEIKSLLG